MFDEYFEILSLAGTVSGGRCHLHVSLGGIVRDGSVDMGTKFAHSDKSVKLGTHVYWTLLFYKNQWKHSGK